MSPPLANNAAVFLTAEIRRLEALAAALPGHPRLMERAGLAAAELARDVSGGTGKPVLILAGPGNNGGDALVVARHLKEWWFKVRVVFTGDAARLSTDAAQAFNGWREAGGAIATDVPEIEDWGLIVDGLFGIGLEREVSGRYADLIGLMNRSPAPVLAVDVPSGLESDSGRVMGCCVRARHTITFIGLKPGLLTLDGPGHCGTLHVATLGIDAPALLEPSGAVIGAEALGEVFQPRKQNTHKGDYGSVGVIGGAHGMVGAALLAGRAALKLGSGRVYVGLVAADAPLVDPMQPELMLRTAGDTLKLDHLTCIAAGPGLGQSPDAAFYLKCALEAQLPLVIDADGLNLVASMQTLRDLLIRRNASTLLTPHPAEAARLMDRATRDVQRDRVGATVALAKTLKSHVVLKGAGSVCASPDGTWAINTSGNPGMASAGMGDALTGIIAALLAQGVAPGNALRAGVYLHGAAADALVTRGVGPVGITAGEVIDAARALANAAVTET